MLRSPDPCPRCTARVLFPCLLALLLAACGGPPMRGDNPEAGMRGERGSMREGEQGGSGTQSVVDQLQIQLQTTADALKLTPRQLPLWDAYQERVSALMADQLRIRSYERANQTALQLIDDKVNTVRHRLTAMEDIAEAARKLYTALDAEQKKVADQRLAQTVPALYSGLVGSSGGHSGSSERRGGGEMGGRGGGMRGGMRGMGGPVVWGSEPFVSMR